MKYITSLLDQHARLHLDQYHHVFYGLSELVKQGSQVMPATIPERKRVSLDAKFDLITWMRQEGDTTVDASQIRGYGRNPKLLQNAPIKWVFAHKVGLGESLVYDFFATLPRIIKDPDKNFSVILIDDTNRSVDSNHEQIYTTELGETAYDKHRLNWNIYAINFRVSFIPCT